MKFLKELNKPGTYEARYYDRWENRKSLYDKNLKELSIAISNNEQFTSIRNEITLDCWFERWMKIYKEKSIRPNTKREYVHIYNKNISPYLGKRAIASIVKSDIQGIVDKSYDAGYKYEGQNKIKVILKDMLQRAMEDQLIIHNPVSGIKLRSDKETKLFRKIREFM